MYDADALTADEQKDLAELPASDYGDWRKTARRIWHDQSDQKTTGATASASQPRQSQTTAKAPSGKKMRRRFRPAPGPHGSIRVWTHSAATAFMSASKPPRLSKRPKWPLGLTSGAKSSKGASSKPPQPMMRQKHNNQMRQSTTIPSTTPVSTVKTVLFFARRLA